MRRGKECIFLPSYNIVLDRSLLVETKSGESNYGNRSLLIYLTDWIY